MYTVKIVAVCTELLQWLYVQSYNRGGMYRIKIVAVGKIKERALSELTGEYLKRLGRYCAVEIIEIANESVSARASDADIRNHQLAEADRILGRLRAGEYIIALDMSGQALSSTGFAKKLESLAAGPYSCVVFVIGGSYGLHPDVLARADFIWSFSELTFPHLLARVLLLEQLYRANKIICNETYHK